MAKRPKWSELSDIQRQSWRLIGPFLGAHLLVNMLLLIAYVLDLTGTALGNSACVAIEYMNAGIVDLYRSLGSTSVINRMCQLYVPISLVNSIFACVLGGLVVILQGIGSVKIKYFILLIMFAILPLLLLAIDPSVPATTRLDNSIQSGSLGTYIVLLVGAPLFTSMAAALLLQKAQEGIKNAHYS